METIPSGIVCWIDIVGNHDTDRCTQDAIEYWDVSGESRYMCAARHSR
jgi:hypothetical protein